MGFWGRAVRAVRRALLVAVVGLALLSLALWLVARSESGQALLRQLVSRVAFESFGLALGYDRISVGLVPPALVLTALRVDGSDGLPLLEVERATVRLVGSELLRGRVVVDEVTVLAPRVRLVVEDGRLANLPELPERDGAEDEGRGGAFAGTVRIVDGALAVELRDRPGEPLRVELRALGLDFSGSPEGRYAVRLVGTEGEVGRGARSRPIHRLEARAALEGDHATVERLLVEVGGLELSVRDATGTLAAPHDLDARAELRVPLEMVSDLVAGVPPLDGSVRLLLEARRSGGETSASARLRGEGLAVTLGPGPGDAPAEPIGLGDLEAGVGFDGETVTIARLELRRPGDGGGTLVLRDGALAVGEPGLPVRAEVALEGLRLERLLAELGVPGEPVRLDLDGELSAEGTLDPVAITLRPLDLWARRLVVPQGSAGGAPPPIVALDAVRLSGTARLEASGVRLDEIAVAVGGSSLVSDADIPFDPARPWRLRVRAAPGALDLADLGPIAGNRLAGRGRLDASVSGLYADPEIEATFDFDGLHAGPARLDRVAGRVGYRAGVVAATTVEVAFGRSSVVIESARVELGGEGPTARAAASLAPVELVDAVRLGGLEGPAAALRGSLRGRVELGWRAAGQRLEAALVGQLDGLAHGETRIGSGPVEVHYGRAGLEVRELDLRGAGSRVAAGGTVAPDGALDLVVSVAGLEVAGLTAGMPAPLSALEGRLELSARLAGTVRAPVGEGRVALVEGRLSGRPIGETWLELEADGSTVSARGRLDGGLLVVDEARVGLAAPHPARLRLSSRTFELASLLGDEALPEGVDLRVRLRADAAAELSPFGRLSGELSLDELRASRGEARARAAAPLVVRLDGQRLDSAGVELRLTAADGSPAGRVRLEPFSVDLGASGPIRASVALEAVVVSALLPPSTLPEGLDVVVGATVAASLDPATPESLEVVAALSRLEAGHAAGRLSADAPFEVRFARGRIETRGVALSVRDSAGGRRGRIRLDLARVGLAPESRSHLRLGISGLDLATLAPPGLLPAGLSLGLDATVNVGGELSRLETFAGGLAVHRLDAERDGVAVSLEDGLTLRVRRERVEIEPAAITVATTATGPASRLRIAGSLSQASLAVTLTGAVDLASLPALVPAVTSAAGRVEVDLGLGGTFASPSLRGALRLDVRSLVLAGLDGRVEGVTGSVRFSDRAVLLEELGGRAFGGVFSASGRLELDGFVPSRYDLSLTARDVAYRLGPVSTVTASAVLALSGGGEGAELPVLSGRVVLSRLLYAEPIRLNLDVARLARRRRVAVQSFDREGARLALDLEIEQAGELRVDNNLMRGRLELDASAGAFRVVGTAGSPGLLGAVVVEPQGTIAFRNTRFEIERGTVVFDRSYEIDPQLDLVARADRRDWAIVLRVDGPSSDPRVALTAVPALSEEDILLLLALGITSAEVQQLGYQDAAASLLPELLWGLSGVGSEVDRFVPFVDEIRVSSEYSARSGRVEPRIEARRELLPSVGLTGSAGLGPSRDLGVGLEYEVARGLAAGATWRSDPSSSFGDLGVDLRWLTEF